jgi:hypothetical protein
MLTERMLLPLSQRLCGQLVQLVDAVGLCRGTEWTIALELPQSDLADLLGAGGRASTSNCVAWKTQAGSVSGDRMSSCWTLTHCARKDAPRHSAA